MYWLHPLSYMDIMVKSYGQHLPFISSFKGGHSEATNSSGSEIFF